MIKMFHLDNTNDVSGSKSKSRLSNDKYFSDLEKWLHEAYMWQGVAASFPYFLMCNQYLSQLSLPLNIGNLQNPMILNNIPVQTIEEIQRQNDRVILRRGIECKIPAVWKRLLAEFLDFLILFVFKLVITWIAIDYYEVIDLRNMDIDGLQLDMKKMDYKVALQMTHNIMILEIIHRIIVGIFETMFLVAGGMTRIGGATPGKSMMGLRVVRCETVIPLSENHETVMVYPGTDLGLVWAFSRSFIKNLLLALFIPFIAAFYYFPFNRAGYDIICNTIVIEEPVIQHRPHQH